MLIKMLVTIKPGQATDQLRIEHAGVKSRLNKDGYVAAERVSYTLAVYNTLGNRDLMAGVDLHTNVYALELDELLRDTPSADLILCSDGMLDHCKIKIASLASTRDIAEKVGVLPERDDRSCVVARLRRERRKRARLEFPYAGTYGEYGSRYDDGVRKRRRGA